MWRRYQNLPGIRARLPSHAVSRRVQRELARNGDTSGNSCSGIAFHAPKWSPDGRQIVFTADFPSTDPNAPPAGGTLALINSDGSNPHRIENGLPRSLIQDDPQWSPDGGVIAFAACDFNGPGGQQMLALHRAHRWVASETTSDRHQARNQPPVVTRRYGHRLQQLPGLDDLPVGATQRSRWHPPRARRTLRPWDRRTVLPGRSLPRLRLLEKSDRKPPITKLTGHVHRLGERRVRNASRRAISRPGWSRRMGVATAEPRLRRSRR